MCFSVVKQCAMSIIYIRKNKRKYEVGPIVTDERQVRSVTSVSNKSTKPYVRLVSRFMTAVL